MTTKRITENRAVVTVEEAVNFAIGAAEEAREAALAAHSTVYHGEKAAREAYRNCMPLLETKASAKCLIAVIAQGVHLDFITAEEAKLLLYGIQVWMQIENEKTGMVTGG